MKNIKKSIVETAVSGKVASGVKNKSGNARFKPDSAGLLPENGEEGVEPELEFDAENGVEDTDSDGLFLETAREISRDYPDIILEETIIDNMCMQLVTKPENYKVIVTMNLYGDILSDLAAGLVGGLGIAPGANIGDDIAIFEAVHGSAPDIAGQNKANPLALILSGIEMLKYMNLDVYAEKIQNAVLKTLKTSGLKTADLGGTSTTTEFTDKIIENL